MMHKRFVFNVCGLAFLVAGCIVSLSCNPRQAAIHRALEFLSRNQSRACVEDAIRDGRSADFEGNWPQFFWFETLPAVRVREVSPFIVAYVHHALASIVPENCEALGLGVEDVSLARVMRQRAMRKRPWPSSKPAESALSPGMKSRKARGFDSWPTQSALQIAQSATSLPFRCLLHIRQIVDR